MATPLTHPQQPAPSTDRARPAPLRALSPAPGAAPAAAELWAGVHLSGADPEKGLLRLAPRARRFTPRVSLAPPDGLLLEVKGSLHLFAGVAGLRAAIADDCRRRKLPFVLAFAPTPLAALAAARAGKPLDIIDPAQLAGRLAPLPLAALRWPEDLLGRLGRMGVRTIGEVLRLPRAGFARRCGAAQLAMLDALTGRTADVRTPYKEPERFRRRRELTCELENHRSILAALAPLFTELGSFLAARQCAVVQLECRLAHRHAPPTRCVLKLAAPAADVQRLAELLGEHLGSLTLPEAVRGCELRTSALVPHRPDCAGLWQPGEHGGESLVSGTSGLIERLRARLGEGAIYGLALLEGHRPENAWGVTEPPLAAARSRVEQAGTRDTAPGNGLQLCHPAQRRPLWLLPVPRPLPVRDGLPRRRGARLRLVAGPERIETGWWDGGEIERDYYTAVDLHGVRLWVFRERAAPHDWYLHGVFG